MKKSLSRPFLIHDLSPDLDVFGEDQDEYSCKASNNGGSRTSRAELEISCKFFFFGFNIVYGKKSLKIQKR
jgi:hypothetical protein